jgi:hypothetical protein
MVKMVPMKTNSRGYSFKKEIYKTIVDVNRSPKNGLKRLELKTQKILH